MDLLAELNSPRPHHNHHHAHALARGALRRRAAVMAHGKKILEGSMREVFSQPEILKQASLIPPEVTRFGLALGFPFLKIEEAAASLEAR